MDLLDRNNIRNTANTIQYTVFDLNSARLSVTITLATIVGNLVCPWLALLLRTLADTPLLHGCWLINNNNILHVIKYQKSNYGYGKYLDIVQVIRIQNKCMFL